MTELITLLTLFLMLIITIFIVTTKNINKMLIMFFSIFALTSWIFALMGIKFLAIVYLIVYTGAVVVLFVIAAKTTQQQYVRSYRKPLQVLISIILPILIFWSIIKSENIKTIYNKIDYKTFSELLFNKNFVIVEIISLILLASIVGAINFLKKEN